MGLDLADLDKWDPNAIHSVFQAAIDRSTGVRGTATTVGNVLASTPWDGAAYDAAVQANGKIRADLIQHADACDAVGRAAATAEAEVRAIKADWTKVQRMADRWGISIHIDTGELSYMDPGNAGGRAEMEHRVDIIEAQIRALLARADAADEDLASAIRGAAGLETPEQIYDELDDQAPQESHAGEAEPEANRTYNQIKAFEQTFGRAPLSSSDWATAAILDPHSYNAKNKGAPPNIVVGKIDKVPGQGVVRTNLFIPGKDVYAPPTDIPGGGFWDMNLGDNRGFDPKAGPEDTRVALLVDYENGVIIARQNPSVDNDTGEVKVGHPSVSATQQPNGSVLVKYNAADAFSPGGEAPAKAIPFSVNGTLGIQPTADGPKIGGDVTTFPALEIYGQRPGMDTQTLLQSWPSFDDGQFGPINGLAFHKTVGDYGIVTSFNDMFPQLAPPPTPSPGPGFKPPIYQPFPEMTVLPPANLTPLGPVSSPPTVIVEQPTVIYPQPPLR
ncbi:hypothetical protein A5662_12565 [Mycobacteriaceae bacterium 1482268.1]|nr:hypothetical protein A5662_12565 [Mycobacteriaceae bacterium 1482268.1]